MIDRRAFLSATCAVTLARAAEPAPRSFGIVIHSYPLRMRTEKGFTQPLAFLEFCKERGADGVQLALGFLDANDVKQVRGTAEKHGLFIEGLIRLPKDKADVERFSKEVQTSRACGAMILRTVLHSGRRYEVFKSAKEYVAFQQAANESLLLALPVVSQHKVRLAIENHKDLRSPELIQIMRACGSEYLGVCVDTGNSIALLEQPMDTIAALAPFAMTCHLKDMGIEESTDGFLLSEVPLGNGFLDLKAIVAMLRKNRADIRFNLEMITRDPLRIPCLTDNYWATLDNVPARELARMLATVKRHAGNKPLARPSTLHVGDQLRLEDENVRQSFNFGRKNLNL